jgi:membrane-associated protein
VPSFDWFFALLDWLLHVDDKLFELVDLYGTWTYAILFAIVFCETGLVIMPLLPGDSLLFAAGAIAANAGSSLNIWVLCLILFSAAVLGDTVNYHVGRYLGPKVLSGKYSRWLNPKYLEKTHQFFECYGGKTIILARFVPIVRTFAPFVAGVGRMDYRKFLFYNVVGGALWVLSMTFAGFWFGSQPWVKKNFEIVVIAIVFISILPAVIEYARHWWLARRLAQAAGK